MHLKAVGFLEGIRLKMASRPDAAHDIVRNAVVDALRDVEGMASPQVTLHKTYDRTNRCALKLQADGWSPSLHLLRMTQVVMLPALGEPMDPALDQMATIVCRLAKRADEARDMGHRKPLPIPENPAVDHLSVDSSLAEMVGAKGISVHGSARNVVKGLHRGTAEQQFWRHISNTDQSIVERDPEPPVTTTVRDVGWRFVPGEFGRDLPSYNGLVLSLNAGALPETVMNAIVGRRLDDLIKVHPALDHRVVRLIHADDLGGADTLYTIGFEYDHVRLGVERVR